MELIINRKVIHPNEPNYGWIMRRYQMYLFHSSLFANRVSIKITQETVARDIMEIQWED